MCGGLKVPPPLLLFVKIIEKVIRLCNVLIFFCVVVVKIGTYYGHFSQIFLSNISIYQKKKKKNGLIFKTTTQFFFFQHSALSYYLFYCFHK